MEAIAAMLEKLGLNKSEARVYAALLTMRDAKASELAARAKVPRNKLYEIAESLSRKGFVEIIPEKVTKFRAVPFDAVCDAQAGSWRQRIEEIGRAKREISQRLQKFSEPAAEKSYFAVLRSRKAIRQQLDDMLASSKRALLLLNVSDMRNLVNIASKASRRTQISVIAPINKDNITFTRKWMQFADVRHFETAMQEKIAVTESGVLIFEFGSPLALYSNDPKFVSMFRNFLESEWSTAFRAESKIRELETGKPAEEMSIVRGREALYRMLPGFFAEAKKDIIVMTSKNGVARIGKHLDKEMRAARARGVRVRLIGIVTRENIELAKSMPAEVRHIDSVHAVSGCYDDTRLVMIDIKSDTVSKSSPDDVNLVTTTPETVQTRRQMLESMWDRATPLKERARELEGAPREETYYLHGRKSLREQSPRFLAGARDVIWTTSASGLKTIHDEYSTAVGQYKGRIRCMAPINEDNLAAAKAMGIEVRHVGSVHALTDVYDDALATIINRKDGNEENDEIIVTNKREIVKMLRQMLESMWQDAIPLAERARQIENELAMNELMGSRALERHYSKRV